MHTTKTIKLIAAAAAAFGANPKRLHLLSRLLSSRKKHPREKSPFVWQSVRHLGPRRGPLLGVGSRARLLRLPLLRLHLGARPLSVGEVVWNTNHLLSVLLIAPAVTRPMFCNWGRRQVSDMKAPHFALANIGSDTEKCRATSKAAFLRSTWRPRLA